ncbi:MAG: UDP-N-acetylglucosamine--N-acetylmuramyl-(pentapeptide) pyrophosphoryl-undecaprenol N-acetylglucosamine transferase [Patescibacteria group bacterium]
MKRLVFTGGHHTSALEVAKALKGKGWQIIWFGHRHSMWGDKSDSAEYTEVTAASIKFIDLKAGKFFRTFNPLKLIRIPFGLFQAFYYLLLLKPVGIVSFGGYMAVPTVLAGWLLGIPSIAHEQTVVSGWANKFISLFVRKVALAWSDSVRHYPPHKSVVIGLPLRSEIIKIRKPKTENRKLIYITGGKQGSQTINKVVFAALPELLANYRIIHQTGNLDYSTAQSYLKDGYECFSFDSSKAVSALSQAAVVVSRAGAHIVYELAYLKKPCVLIPISHTSHDEQLLNAQILERNHQAVILPESKLSPQSLISSIKQAFQLIPGKLMLPIDASEKLIKLIEQQFQ